MRREVAASRRNHRRQEVAVVSLPRTLPAALSTAVLVVTLAACGSGNSGSSSAPSAAPSEAAPATGAAPVQLIKEGQLTTCTQLPYEPFQFRQGDKIVGFDVDMVDLVAQRLGVPQQIVETPFDNIQSGVALDTGLCDIGAAAMTITDTRKQNLDFSEPYFDATQALLVPPNSPIKGPEQLQGKRLGVQNGTTGQQYAQENLSGAQIVVFDDIGLELTAVQTGEIDAAINDNAPLLDFAGKNAGFAVTAQFNTGEQYGYAMKKGNTALKQAVDATITEAKANGKYNELFKKWFPAAPAS
jgi:polar amino acid transport system substrate-binding protein